VAFERCHKKLPAHLDLFMDGDHVVDEVAQLFVDDVVDDIALAARGHGQDLAHGGDDAPEAGEVTAQGEGLAQVGVVGS